MISNGHNPDADASRRDVMLGAAGLVLAASAPAIAQAAPAAHTPSHGESTMPYITAKDGAQIYYKDWGKGQPIVFSHGWPLSADDWDAQMMFFGAKGYRVIAHDRRGHGRSTQTWDGNEMDTYADDLLALVTALDLKDAIHIGHSTGGGEVTRYLARHGTKRASRAVLLSAVPPLMVKTPANPEGTPIEAFDGIRAGVLADRSATYRQIPVPFYGANRPGAPDNKGLQEKWWLQGMMGGVKAHYDCIKAFSETDFTEDLKKVDIPVLVMHGSDDQIVPLVASAPKTVKLLKKGTLKIYDGFDHGMPASKADIINPDILAWLKS